MKKRGRLMTDLNNNFKNELSISISETKSRVMFNTAGNFFNLVLGYMQTVISTVISDNNSFATFLVDITEYENSRTIIDKVKIVQLFSEEGKKKCYELVKDKTKKDYSYEQFESDVKKAKNNIKKILNEKITYADFLPVLQSECQALDTFGRKNYLLKGDIQALVKAINPRISPKSFKIFSKCLRQKNPESVKYNFNKICFPCITIRNAYVHNSAELSMAYEQTYKVESQNVAWQTASAIFMDLVEYLRIDDVEVTRKYTEVKKYYQKSQDILEYKVYYFSDFVDETISEIDLEGLCADKNLAYSSEYKYVFYKDFDQEVEKVKIEKANKDKQVEYSEFATIFQPIVPNLLSFYQKNPEFFGISLSATVNPDVLLRNLNARMKQAGIAPEVAETVEPKPVNTIPVLDKLVQKRKNRLNDEQIQELLNTHKVMLTKAVFTDEKTMMAFKAIVFGRYKVHPKNFVVDINVVRDIYTHKLEYDKKKKLGDVSDELKLYNSGYLLLSDVLRKHDLIEIVGEIHTTKTYEENLVSAISTLSDTRLSVWFGGEDAAWVDKVDKYANPYYTFCCIVNKGYIEGTRKIDVRIFSPCKFLRTATESGVAERLETIKENKKAVVANSKPIKAEKKKDEAPKKEKKVIFKKFSLPTEPKAVSTEMILIDKPVKVNDVVFTENKEQILITHLLSDELMETEGGEGTVYKIKYVTGQPPKDNSGKNITEIAKIFHTSDKTYTLTQDRYEKIKVMVKNNPGIKEMAWPTHMLFNDENQFVGYLMPKAPSSYKSLQSSVEQIDKPAMRQGMLKNWDRYTLSLMCAKICSVFDRLHHANIFVGDVNMGNIMVDTNDPRNVLFIDCDSYQFDGFTCPVGTEEFISPFILRRVDENKIDYKKILRTEQEENYSIAILLFKVMMMDLNPFKCIGVSTIKEINKAKVECSFPFADNRRGLDAGKDYDVMWMNFIKALREDFIATFKDNQNITPSKFENDFKAFAKVFQKYKDRDRSLEPVMYVDYGENLYDNSICKYCGNEFNHRKMIHPKYCNKCNSLFQIFENRLISTGKGEIKNCKFCGKPVKVNLLKAKMIDQNVESCVCDQCNEQIQLICTQCGKVYKDRRGHYNIISRRPRFKPLCPECLQEKLQRRSK